jgi:hypothetical protein
VCSQPGWGAWLSRRYLLSALLGSIGGPIELRNDLTGSLWLIAGVRAFAMPVLVRISDAWSPDATAAPYGNT